jgi:hypothetical protein
MPALSPLSGVKRELDLGPSGLLLAGREHGRTIPLTDLPLFASDVRFQVLSRPNPLAVMVLCCAARKWRRRFLTPGKVGRGAAPISSPQEGQIPQASRRALELWPESACLSCRHVEIASQP